MSRFDSDGDETYPYQFWQHWVAQTFHGKRGRAMLRELKAALEAMPEHRLIRGEIAAFDWRKDEEDGEPVFCAVGAFAAYRAVKRDGLSWREACEALPNGDGDPYETAWLGERHGMSYTMAWEVGRFNDEHCADLTDEARWQAVYDWVCSKLQLTGV